MSFYILQWRFLLLCSSFSLAFCAWGMGSEKKVLLKDVDVLTLYNGKMTKGQRSSPVPQLECVGGGSAPCSAYTPKVVQCQNRGSDGYDVQWECKSDMDNAYRFGEIDVSCEGFDYPDDPYILHGSCGLRYSIDYSKEGHNQQGSHSYYGDNSYSSQSSKYKSASTSSIIADLIVYIGMGLLIYALYKTCINPGRHSDQAAYSSTDSDSPSGGGGGTGGRGGGYGWFGGGGNGGHGGGGYGGYQDDASCHNRYAGRGAGGGGGFWTGAATGGLLGYMMGNRGGGHRNYGGYGNTGSSWFGGSGGGYSRGFSGGSGGFSSGGSSGTRSASGFGGTSRR